MKEDNLARLASLMQLFSGMQQLAQPDYRGRQLDLQEQGQQADIANQEQQTAFQREQFLQQIAQADRAFGLSERQFEQQGQLSQAELEQQRLAAAAQQRYYDYQMDPNNPQNARALQDVRFASEREPIVRQGEEIQNRLKALDFASAIGALFDQPQMQLFNPEITPPQEQERLRAQLQDYAFSMANVPFNFSQQSSNAYNNIPR